MANSAVACLTQLVTDTDQAWATKRGPTLAAITFWFNPASNMTMQDVVTTIERNLGPMRISFVTCITWNYCVEGVRAWG